MQTRRRRSTEEWTEILEEFEQSRLGFSAFARSYGVGENSLRRWHARLWVERAPSPEIALVPVDVVGTPRDDRALVVVVGRYGPHFGDYCRVMGPPPLQHDGATREGDLTETFAGSWGHGGTGLIVDLGYASLRLLSDCESHDVRYVVRLKDNWKPRLDRIVRGAAPSSRLQPRAGVIVFTMLGSTCWAALHAR